MTPTEIERLRAINAQMLAVLLELQESAAYWSEYDVPLGIVDRIDAAIAAAKTGEPRKREPLIDEVIWAHVRASYDPEDCICKWTFAQGARFAERHHGITGEKA